MTPRKDQILAIRAGLNQPIADLKAAIEGMDPPSVKRPEHTQRWSSLKDAQSCLNAARQFLSDAL